MVEAAGPPKRHRFRPKDKHNHRDLTHWVAKESINAYAGVDRIPGLQEFYIDYTDSPDRYFITSNDFPIVGHRRLYRFAAFPVTQYYILERLVVHECLEADGGEGMTYLIESGPSVFARKDWRSL